MAIAFDAVSSSAVNGGTWSHNVGGTNSEIYVFTEGDTTDNTPTIDIAGVNIPLFAKTSTPSDRFVYGFYLLNPPTGTNKITITGSTFKTGMAITHSGVFRASVDSFGTTQGSATSLVGTTNVVDTNCWVVMSAYASTGSLTATNFTARGTTTDGLVIFDTNGTVNSGNYLGTLTDNGASRLGLIISSFSPNVAVSGGLDLTSKTW